VSDRWPKVFRDPVHNLIAFHDKKWDRLLLELINTREVQRLRRIKQLGFSELVFPGANHSRFAHSLGVLHVTKKFLAQFDLVGPKRLSPYQRSLVLAAALLHDIGHGPFSHAFEKVTGIKHEKFTRDIISDPATQVCQKLRKFSRQLPRDLAQFFDEEADSREPPADLPPYLTQVISSQLDADRCDYLLRDSYATGTDYGRYDLEWLLSHIQPGHSRWGGQVVR
jgi:HD superfamily phosphohydrolase